jgi:hypothetical protein
LSSELGKIGNNHYLCSDSFETASMNPRRIIALLLLALYLFAVGGEAAAALSCDCVRLHAHPGHEHPHCICCVHHDAASAGDALHLTAPCCDDSHSTEIALYTALSSLLDKAARRVVLALPPTLAAELPAVAEQLLHRCDAAERPDVLPDDGLLRAAALRAPPARG